MGHDQSKLKNTTVNFTPKWFTKNTPDVVTLHVLGTYLKTILKDNLEVKITILSDDEKEPKPIETTFKAVLQRAYKGHYGYSQLAFDNDSGGRNMNMRLVKRIVTEIVSWCEIPFTTRLENMRRLKDFHEQKVSIMPSDLVIMMDALLTAVDHHMTSDSTLETDTPTKISVMIAMKRLFSEFIMVSCHEY